MPPVISMSASPQELFHFLQTQLSERVDFFESATRQAGFRPGYYERPTGSVNLWGTEYPAGDIAEMLARVGELKAEIIPYQQFGNSSTTMHEQQARALLQFEEIAAQAGLSHADYTRSALKTIGIESPDG